MRSNNFILKSLPEILIALIPAYFVIALDLLKGLGVKAGILPVFPSIFFFMTIILLLSLIVSAVRDQEGWRKEDWLFHCALIALAVPVGLAVWDPFSRYFTKPLPDSDPFWSWVGCVILALVLLPSSLFLGLCVRWVMFSRFSAKMLSFGSRIVAVSLLGLSFAVSLFVLTGGLEPRKVFDPNPDRFSNLSFTYDGEAIVFGRKNGKADTQIQVYDLHSGELAAFVPPQDELWTMPRCSITGRQIIFVVQPPDEYRYPDTTQIATINTNGSEFKKLTNCGGRKSYPALSHSGRSFIYAKDENMSGPGKMDIYEADAITMVEKRITKFGFFVTLFLQYLPDGKQFAFTGERPSILPETQGSERELTRWSERNIYVMRLDDARLKPLPVRQDRLGQLISAPGPLLVDKEHAMYFCDDHIKGEGRHREDWQQCYAYSSDGNHRLIASIKAEYLPSAALSPDGKRLAIVYRTESKDHDRIAIFSVGTGQREEVAIPKMPIRTIRPK